MPGPLTSPLCPPCTLPVARVRLKEAIDCSGPARQWRPCSLDWTARPSSCTSPRRPPPKSSPASLPLTQAERGSKLRGGGGLQAWLAVPMGPVAGSELAFVRECPLVLPGQVEGEPPMSISWQWDRLALTNASSTTLMPNGFLHLAVCPLPGASPPVPTSPTVWPRTAWCSWDQIQLASK